VRGRTAILLLLLSALPCSPMAFAASPGQSPDLGVVLAGVQKRIESADLRATGRLVRVGGNGERTSYKFSMKAHWFPDGLRVLCEITQPGAARTRLLLHMTANGHTTIEVAQPGSKTASALPAERWNEPLLGTDFSYEDLAEGQFFWKGQELLAPEKCGTRDCVVLKSVSSADDRSEYESVTSWIDRGIFYPVHVLKTIRATQQQKDFTYYGLRQSSGVWSASQVEIKVQGKPGSSLLVIDGGSEKAKLMRKDFDLNPPDVHGEE